MSFSKVEPDEMRWTIGASLCWGALFAVSACVTQSSPPATWEEADAEIARCFDAMDKDPALARVNAKYARTNPTPAQLADPTRPAPEEVDALRLRVEKTRPCRALRLAAVARFRPLLTPSYRTLYYQADQVIAYLTDGLISYGTANRLAKEALQAFERRAVTLATAPQPSALSTEWDEALQRAHSNPPPGAGPRACTWAGLNIACDRSWLRESR
jgi:hypothetical protein